MRLLNKKGVLTLLAVLFIFGVSFVPNGFADTITAYFNFDSNNNPSASEGQVVFTLNGNGTIAASLVDFNSSINGFGFNSAVANLPESNFSPSHPINTNGWSDNFGLQNSGFLGDSSYLQNVTVTWTIGNPGDFTSVLDVLDGGVHSSHQFFLIDSYNVQWAGDDDPPTMMLPGLDSFYVSSSTVPEPTTMLLFGLGLVGLAGVRRKFKN
jgi:hypothetical protein